MQKVIMSTSVTDIVQTMLGIWINLSQFGISNIHLPIRGSGGSVGIATELRAGRSGDRIPVRGEISAPVHTDPGAHRRLYNGYRVFPRG
jgi:hypothetical protein